MKKELFAMIKRELYLSRIRPFIDQTELIKVLVGVRRSGKSMMLELIKEELKARSIPSERMILINFEDMTYASLSNAASLHDYLKEKIELKYGDLEDESGCYISTDHGWEWLSVADIVTLIEEADEEF
jgi:predicted AAA+ superfamily ATPase